MASMSFSKAAISSVVLGPMIMVLVLMVQCLVFNVCWK
jgi:hypothetical protein